MNLSDFGPEVRTSIRGMSKEEMNDLLKRSGIGLEPPHYIDCPTEIQATWRHKHYLARPSRRKYANSPSVPHSFVKAWFGPTVYYARRSRRRKNLHMTDDDRMQISRCIFPEYVNREVMKHIDPNLMDFMYQHADGLDDYLKYANEREPDPRLAIFPPAEKDKFRGVEQRPFEAMVSDLNCDGYRGKDGRVWRDGRWTDPPPCPKPKVFNEDTGKEVDQ